MKLIELLVTITIISILACMLLVGCGKAFKTCQAWLWGADYLNKARITAAIDGNDKQLEVLLNQKVTKWSFVQ